LEKTTEANFFRNRPDRLPCRLPRRHPRFTKRPGVWKPAAHGVAPRGPAGAIPIWSRLSPPRRETTCGAVAGCRRLPDTGPGVRDFPFALFGIRPERQA
jgi:hypothetical protein